MIRCVLLGAATGLTLALGISAALGENSCDFLHQDVLFDGQFYVQASETKFVPFRSFAELNLKMPTRLHFIYVVRTFGEDRNGILVIKSAKTASPADDQQAALDQVRLVRRKYVGDAGCRVPKPFSAATISAKAYEDYHDYALKDTPAVQKDERSIKDFHVEYKTDRTRRGCIATDDTSSYFDWWFYKSPSNRSQFSFDPKVVSDGLYVALRDFLNVRVASAFTGLARQRTEIKKYLTSAGLACVRFSIKADGPDYVLRVSDLEGGSGANSRRRGPKPPQN